MGTKISKCFDNKNKKIMKETIHHGYNPCYQVETPNDAIEQIPDLPPSKLMKPPKIVITPAENISESSEDSDFIMPENDS